MKLWEAGAPADPGLLNEALRRFLYRAQHDPVLEFKETGAGE
jgi:hypothetical protein